MATRGFARRPRLTPPSAPTGEFVLQPPPELPRVAPVSVMTYIMPLGMIAMVVGFVVVGGFNTASLMMGAMMLVMTVSMIGGNRSGGRDAAQLTTDRQDYLAYLAGVRGEITQVRSDQYAAAFWANPAPSALWSYVGGARMWERRPLDEDFIEVRMATGRQQLAAPLRPPQAGPIHETDPISAVALSQLVRTYATVDDLPVTVQLSAFPVIEIGGDRDGARAMVRAALAQLAAFHGPDAVTIAAVGDSTGRSHWDWLKWLPHNQHPSLTDSLGAVRLVAGSLNELTDLLSEQLSGRAPFTERTPLDLDQRQIVVVLDGATEFSAEDAIGANALSGVTLIDLSPSPMGPVHPGTLSLVVDGDTVGIQHEDDVQWLGRPDQLSQTETETLARALAPYRMSEGAADADGAIASNDLADLLGLSNIAQLDPAQCWQPRSGRDLLRVPIGIGASGEAVELDLKESAFGGMGPHGLLVGATGSGKSELLRTLVLALAIEHSPEQLNLVLIDFKGGATFAGLQDLPHVAAVITNLQDDLSMVDRMHEALSGEMNRRQEMLRAAGNLVNVRDYERLRASGADLAPLPSLFIVCDEFSELLAQKPDFAELFVAIGRLGRSLGLHLLLASQRLEEGKLRGLDSHLSYRIGLKTFSAAESRTVLGVADAYELPPVPGNGFLKFDSTSMARFKAAYVSAPFVEDAVRAVSAPGRYSRPVSFVSSRVELIADPLPEGDVPTPAAGLMLSELAATASDAEPVRPSRTMLDVVVSRLSGHGAPAHEVWLPPLDLPATLEQLLSPLAVTAERGLHSTAWQRPLTVPIGIVDLPFEQRRDALVLDLSGGAGNGAVVGGPQSGKSLTLRTLIAAMALTHTPLQVQCFVIDFGGGALAPTVALPHVSGVATRADPAYLRRLIAEVVGIFTERETRFREAGVESMADYRALRAAGDPRAGQDPFGDVFLIVDGWTTLREDFGDLEERITALAGRGLSYGVHVLISANRWQDIRPNIKDSLGTRIELRLGDPYESEVDRALAQLVPPARPGRGLTSTKKHMLTALARLDGDTTAAAISTGFGQLAAQIAQSWGAAAAPAVRVLPERLAWESLPLPTPGRSLPIGIDEDALSPVYLDFDADPHLVYFADGESGKSTFLRTVLTGLQTRYPPAEARVLLVDYRRSLLGVLPKDYLAGYAAAGPGLESFLGDLIPILQNRIPGQDVTVEQLRNRSWWSGPEVFVVVDDYDLVAVGANPLLPLRDLLPQAKDIGLHVIMTRRTSGASRSMFDPIVQTLRDLGAAGFVGAGPTDEGVVWGATRPQPTLPPGRGTLITRRRGATFIQVAKVEDPVVSDSAVRAQESGADSS